MDGVTGASGSWRMSLQPSINNDISSSNLASIIIFPASLHFINTID